MITLLFSLSLAAQDTTRLTLSQTIDRALATYPTVAAAKAQRERVAADLGEAKSARLPRVNLDGSLFRYQLPNVVAPLHGFDPRNPPLFDQTLIQSAATLNWTVLDFGARSSRVRAQRALGNAADAVVSAAEMQLIARAANAYLRVLSARDVLAAQDQRLAALASLSERTRQLLAEGKAARLEGLRVEAEAKRAQADRIAGASQLDVAEHDLAQLTQTSYESVHRATLSPLHLADTTLTDTAKSVRDAIATQARQSSNEVKELAQRARATDAGISAAKAAWFPEFRVAGGYMDYGRWSGDFAGEWRVGLAVTYPLYNGGSREAGIHRAVADGKAAAEQLRNAQLNVEQSVDRSLAALREAHARVNALQSAVDQSVEVVRIERLTLDVGSGTQTEYLDAEANLLRTRASLIDARNSEISARVELARITGELSRDWLARTVESAP
jgi:multidrug efflux system outer membrane protein